MVCCDRILIFGGIRVGTMVFEAEAEAAAAAATDVYVCTVAGTLDEKFCMIDLLLMLMLFGIGGFFTTTFEVCWAGGIACFTIRGTTVAITEADALDVDAMVAPGVVCVCRTDIVFGS